MQQRLPQTRRSLVLTCAVVFLGTVVTPTGPSTTGPSPSLTPRSGHEASRTTDPWFQDGPKIVPSDEVGAGKFGTSVALSADGATALIGGPDDNGGPGAAWVFTRTASGWDEQAKLVPNDEGGDGKFGSAVALSADGNTALVGAPQDSGGKGAAWAFTRSGSTWAQQGKKILPDDESGPGQFGASVVLSADGTTALIGGL